MPIPLLLDTDIGSDVDDELALALIWGSPELDLRGVCTTYGDVALRMRIVMEMAVLSGRGLSVAPGRSATRSGRQVWWAGHEGDAYGPLRQGPPDPSQWAQPSPGALLLSAHADGAQLLAIGPLGSVADAIELGSPGLQRIVLMGGDWADPAEAEHNIASDSTAARAVLASGLPITAVGVDVTRRVRFGEDEIRRFAACGHLGAILAVEMRAWMRRWDEDFEVPHDPLAALLLVEPQLFTIAEPCAVEVSHGAGGSFGPEGAVRRLDAPGAVRVVTGVDADAARRSMADRIAAGLGEVRRTV